MNTCEICGRSEQACRRQRELDWSEEDCYRAGYERLKAALADAIELAEEGWRHVEARDRFDWYDVASRFKALQAALTGTAPKAPTESEKPT